ncbi:MAG: hypothetical protein F4X74_14005 [Acidimicrobiia bacterium]|nr:hypothetical protein [Acidimicrobiia bacterium]
MGRELAEAAWARVHGQQVMFPEHASVADLTRLEAHMAATVPGVAAPEEPANDAANPLDPVDIEWAVESWVPPLTARLEAVNEALADVAAAAQLPTAPRAWTLAGLNVEAAIHEHVTAAVGPASAAATDLYETEAVLVTGQPWPRVEIREDGRVRDPVHIAADVEAATLAGRHVTNPLQPLLVCWATHYRPEAKQHSRRDLLLPVQWPKEARRMTNTAAAPAIGQAQLPAPGLSDHPHLPDHLYRVGVGRAVEHRNRYAPLPFRIWLEGQLGVPPDQRRSDMATTLEVTVRDLLAWCYPGPGRRPKRHRWQPGLERAAEALASQAAAVLRPDGTRWWPVLLRGDFDSLDSPVALEVLYPQSERPAEGAPVWMDHLRAAGVRSPWNTGSSSPSATCGGSPASPAYPSTNEAAPPTGPKRT